LTYYQSQDEVEIQSTPEKTYRALTDWNERSRWRPGLKMKWTGDARAFVGQVVSFEIEGAFPPASFSYRITGLKPPRSIYVEYADSALSGRAAMEVTPLEKGCRVSFYWMKVVPRGFWARGYFALGFGLSSHRTRTRQTLEMLKKHLESVVA
jgi:uncharacterized protein YndB with AHSA1/START domain